ncbi:MAG: V-type ATP synthase subunit D [Victivallales bacterium]|nr:V-type ATP synthase subunit D [Victivallales bacterium]
MPKVKFTKTALKAQRDALKQFTRFLPTLQLKKQQLQMEMRLCQAALSENEGREADLRRRLDHWIALFGDVDSTGRLSRLVVREAVETGEKNIAGVDVPTFREVRFADIRYDLFIEEPWFDDAIVMLKQILSVRAEHEILQRQYDLLAMELRTTTQRVNLFEKVKIPECRANIKRIQIFLGDMSTASVARSKIAKKKSQEVAA